MFNPAEIPVNSLPIVKNGKVRSNCSKNPKIPIASVRKKHLSLESLVKAKEHKYDPIPPPIGIRAII